VVVFVVGAVVTLALAVFMMLPRMKPDSRER
jgi:NADH:ubiquinone oxidoreductase subunit 6 (subunit J)